MTGLLDILEPSGSGLLSRTFDMMDDAEELLREFGDPPGAFALVAPTPLISSMAVHRELYRSHARELLERLRGGAKPGRDLGLGTVAEVLVGLAHASQAAPLTSEAFRIYEWAFQEVFGPGAREQLGLEPARPLDDWVADEPLYRARMQARSADRESWRPPKKS